MTTDPIPFEGLFLRSVEYPDLAVLHADGVEACTWYEYVPSTFLNSLLFALVTADETTVHAALLLERHYGISDPFTDEEIAAIQAKHRASPHTRLGDYGSDVILVIETPGSFWVLHLDPDVSDCSMGRIKKSEHVVLTVWGLLDAKMVVASVRAWANGNHDFGWKIRTDIPTDTLRGEVSW